jgi:predicted alpha/beta superfamily hydrolase
LQIFIKPSPLIDSDGPPPPIVYILDAEQSFPLLAAYSWSLTFTEEMPPSIIVGIGYGTSNPSINKRNRDYTAPGDNPQYGGADIFMDVLEKEIFPKVEALTGGNPEQRILVGQSLGGQFVVHAALNKPGLVDLGIAINPALHNNLPLFRDALAKTEGETQLQSLYITSAAQDADRFRIPARVFIAEADAKQDLPFCLKTEILADHTHLSSMPRAFRNGMRWHHGDKNDCENTD